MAFPSRTLVCFALDMDEVNMELWMWIGGALLVLANLEAWNARQAARKAANEAAAARVELGVLRDYLSHRLDGIEAGLDEIEEVVTARELGDVDPSEAP